ncbi:nucleotidyltransferase family protein [Algoriphagus zhangzhouensis]|uniref:Molybdenum cofactor cytidylyltransferase n=1 Tax=Algoriphagus zhangzhouensis TaxID=1073327 RepID=A0A1M7Z5B0_9BACT|nr:nucleotidyltransferase family protein [Algoriphagus zhangzhouensis]TDY48859.1 molybdenum cofactor cytidylyltransferase [Algoriphagus zhangzhouensis]SHO60065.1 molybdenum cofactor cytidylyltransferase [Algoriphagus zhangzhouensis]
MKTGVLILAAGSSSRLGKPKQLLKFGEETLLSKTIKSAQEAILGPVLVVLGSQSDLIKSTLKIDGVKWIVNQNWESGMASSLQVGLKFLEENYDPDQVLVLLSDQPFVSTELIHQLMTKKENSANGIAACSYSDTIGVPAIIEKKYFSELLNLKGDQGAKKVIKHHLDDLVQIPFENGKIDIDTQADWENLQYL